MSRTTDQPGRPGARYEKDREAVENVLRNHLSDADAALLAERMQTIDEDERTAEDWQAVKHRTLHKKR